jgi:hypothetical protein
MEVKEMVRKGQNINAQVFKGQVIIIPGGGGGDIDPEAIKEAVDEYLEANPPAQGAPGKDGADGKDGYTPVKGVDYFTPAEVEEIAAQAAEMVEVPDSGGNVDQSQIAQAVANYLTQNPVTGGMTKTEKNLILTLFRNAVYTSGGMGALLTQLETIWSGSGSGGSDETITITQSGTTLTISGVASITTITQTGSVLALA